MHIEDDQIYLTVDDATHGMYGAHTAGQLELEAYLGKKLGAFADIQAGALDRELLSQGVQPGDVPEGEYANMLIDDAKNVPVIKLPLGSKSFVENLASAIRTGLDAETEGIELMKRTQIVETPELARKRAAEYKKRDVGYKPNLRVIRND